MTSSQQPNKLFHVERLYALWLQLYPRAHRRAYGPLMLQTFQDCYRDALSTPGGVGPRFWLAVVGDEAKSLGREYGTVLHETGQRLKHRTIAIASGMLLSGGAFVYVFECVR
jgi:hypothetical protein